MLEELQRRDYSHSTARSYLHVVSDFAKHFRRSPDTLGPEHIRQYQLHLFHKKLSPYTIRQHTAALRFFFFKTLHRNFHAEYIPFPKFRKRLPTILSPEEVGRLIHSAGAGLSESLVFYCGRHDYGTRVLRETGNLAAVMMTMGHKDGKTASQNQHPELEIVRQA